MLVAFRPFYASRLVCEVVRKTTVSYELLVWLNVEDPNLEAYIANLVSAGSPIRIVGKTPGNIGMLAFKNLIVEAKGNILVQLEDDVINISRQAAEIADDIFNRYPDVHMVGGHVWQDEYTTGGRPPMSFYNPQVLGEGLYEGPIDGGFTFYRRTNIPLMLDNSIDKYFGLGVSTHLKLIKAGIRGWMTIKIMMFHLHGPIYHSFFPGMLDFEIKKYRGINYFDVAQAYEDEGLTLPDQDEIARRLKNIDAFFESFNFHDNASVLAYISDLEKRIPPVTKDASGAYRIDRPGRRGCWHYVS
jgi:hypothetical protein